MFKTSCTKLCLGTMKFGGTKRNWEALPPVATGLCTTAVVGVHTLWCSLVTFGARLSMKCWTASLLVHNYAMQLSYHRKG